MYRYPALKFKGQRDKDIEALVVTKFNFSSFFHTQKEEIV